VQTRKIGAFASIQKKKRTQDVECGRQHIHAHTAYLAVALAGFAASCHGDWLLLLSLSLFAL